MAAGLVGLGCAVAGFTGGFADFGAGVEAEFAAEPEAPFGTVFLGSPLLPGSPEGFFCTTFFKTSPFTAGGSVSDMPEAPFALAGFLVAGAVVVVAPPVALFAVPVVPLPVTGLLAAFPCSFGVRLSS